MESLRECVDEYRRQVQKGAVPKAYRAILDYIMSLRTHFADSYPDHFVSGSVYQGYMDMTYFAVVPQALKRRSLKVAVVFVHPTCRFEVWLAGYNKRAQEKYWQLIGQSQWHKYQRVETTQGADSILEHVLVETPDFSKPSALTRQIESGTVRFIKDIDDFLARQGI